jgi:cytochrome c553
MIRVATVAVCLALAAFPGLAEEEGEEGEGGARAVALTNPATQTECGSCHMAYQPGFLPARSWKAIMGDLGNHFGENAQLDAATRTGIETFLVGNAADAATRPRPRDPAPGATPLRISALPWFVAEHGRKVSAAMKAKAGSMANCTACHPGAAQGVFEDD